MINRRELAIRAATTLSALACSPAIASVQQINASAVLTERIDRELKELGDAAAPSVLARNEGFWAQVRKTYVLNPNVLNLDHGWTNPTTQEALDELARGATRLEALPAEELDRMFSGGGATAVRRALGEALGVQSSAIALVRNATEALNTILLGYPLQAGDEIVCSAHDYYATLDALEQRRARDGVVLRMVKPAVPAPSLAALAEFYEAAIGPRTRLVLVTHVSNRTGQLYPVRRIAVAAHKVGAEVVVDGAQSLGLHDEPVSGLDCDYYGASAHKWLGTPVGLGVLWMRPAHTAKIWPLMPPPPGTFGMRRFEWIGTAPAYLETAALPALALHNTLGAARKTARLRYLAAHLRERMAAFLPNARFYTAADPAMSLGITTIDIPGVSSEVLQRRLRTRHHILTQSMDGGKRAPEIRGLRISPNVYTTLAELELAAVSLKEVI